MSLKMFAVVALGSVWLISAAAPAEDPPIRSELPDQPQVPIPVDRVQPVRVSLDVARDRARLMHDYSVSMLEMLHHRYFHDDKVIIPARAMEDVFAELKLKTGAEVRWISGNMDAMNIRHEPKSDFELKAVKEFKAGKTQLETIEDGYFRQAGIVPFQSECINCHAGFFKTQTRAAKFAGLIISMPILPLDRPPILDLPAGNQHSESHAPVQ